LLITLPDSFILNLCFQRFVKAVLVGR
jgi:hypothetical protein